MIGYRVTVDGWTDAGGEQVWLKASQVDRRLSWTKLRAQLGAEARDRLPATPSELGRHAFPIPAGEAVRQGQRRRTAQAGRPTRRPVVRDPDRRDLDRGR